MLLESRLPKQLWNNAVETAATVRNGRFNRRSGQAPDQLFTGRKAPL